MNNKRIGRYFSIVHKFAMVFFKNRMNEFGLHRSHHSVLFSLYKSEGISQEKLSKMLNVDKATVTRTVKKLLENGLIERRQDESDKRAYLLFVTDKGKALKPKIETAFEAWDSIVLDGFTDEEIKQLMSYMERISSNVLGHHEATELKCHKENRGDK
jgi:DNA-binding MarR family transcriptional regulator